MEDAYSTDERFYRRERNVPSRVRTSRGRPCLVAASLNGETSNAVSGVCQ